MDETAKGVPVPPGRWLALVVAAVILAEGIWAMLVSVTRSLLLPLVARVTGGDSQSALYLGKGDVNVPDLFGSVLQLCLAGILFLIIKAWASKGPRVKTMRVVKASKPVSQISIAPQPAASTAQAAASAIPVSQPAGSAIPVSQPAGQPVAPPEVAQRSVQPKPAFSPEPAQPSVQPQPAPKPAKPKKPQEVYYNIVGEPITPEDE